MIERYRGKTFNIDKCVPMGEQSDDVNKEEKYYYTIYKPDTSIHTYSMVWYDNENEARQAAKDNIEQLQNI
jgi:hypothetical protein